MFDKLDAYNLVANLVPGAALTFALTVSNFPTPEPENIGAFLICAFVAGVTANRLGSLVVDPALRKVGFLKEKDYRGFVELEEKDSKLEILVSNSGLYRTFLVCGLAFFALLGARGGAIALGLSDRIQFAVLVAIGMIVFLFALRKEDGYIYTRIQRIKDAS